MLLELINATVGVGPDVRSLGEHNYSETAYKGEVGGGCGYLFLHDCITCQGKASKRKYSDKPVLNEMRTFLT